MSNANNVLKLKDRSTIWRVPKYLPLVQPILTDEVVAAAEEKIGGKLPQAYLELLRVQNGGYIRFTIPDTPHSQIYGIGPHYSSLTQYEWLKDYKGTLSYEIEGLIPFDGDGHWNICLDYRKNKVDPEITYIDTESDYERGVARNFDEYLTMLELDVDDRFFIETDLSLEELSKQISTITGIDFGKPNSFAHGYVTFTGNYKDSWVWLTPNEVPEGFIRESDERYEELKSLMGSSAVRFPEISRTCLFIQVSTNDMTQELFSILGEAGIKAKELKDALENNFSGKKMG